MQNQNELQIKTIVDSLPELWQDYRKIESAQARTHPYREVILRLRGLLGIHDHNKLIDWLDEKSPTWRGEEKPKLCPTQNYRKAA